MLVLALWPQAAGLRSRDSLELEDALALREQRVPTCRRAHDCAIAAPAALGPRPHAFVTCSHTQMGYLQGLKRLIFGAPPPCSPAALAMASKFVSETIAGNKVCARGQRGVAQWPAAGQQCRKRGRVAARRCARPRRCSAMPSGPCHTAATATARMDPCAGRQAAAGCQWHTACRPQPRGAGAPLFRCGPQPAAAAAVSRQRLAYPCNCTHTRRWWSSARPTGEQDHGAASCQLPAAPGAGFCQQQPAEPPVSASSGLPGCARHSGWGIVCMPLKNT